ncbi:MAG TPA: PQQ-binding-like beta-propeller repeat protein [Gemmataceae bacterium]|nr:PQQ-binding-like beta-propeller repeat protein [Gemmataceae bacterium]
MIAQNERQRTRRVWLGVLAGLVVIGAFLGSYYLYLKHSFRGGPAWLVRLMGEEAPVFVPDPELLQGLQAAPLERNAARPVGEWPQWRGPNRDGVSAETGLLKEWPEGGPRKVWEAKGGEGYSSFAVAGGKVYTLLQDGDNETVVCWDAATGKEVWRFGYPCRYENSWGSGPRSTPAVHDGLVYTVGATGIFHCLKADTGAKVWRHDLLDEFKAENLQWGVSFSPLIEGDLVLTNPGGPDGNSIAAFDRKTGRLIWKALDDPAGYSSPVAATLAGVRQVLFFTARGLVSVSPADGKELWRYDWTTEYDANIATPIVVDDYVFISSGYGRGAAVLKVESADGGLRARRVYQTNQMANHFSTSVYYREHLYGFTDPGILVCMEFRTGKVRWKERGFDKGSLTIADGHLFILGEQGTLALAEATPEAYREKSRCQPFQGKCWTVPVLCNGRLYLRDEAKVLCLEVRAP